MALSKIDPDGLNIGQIGGRRNKVINGNMMISQRGSVTVNNGATGKVYCAADRWNVTDYFGSTGQVVTTIDSDVPSGQGFTSSLKLNCTTTLSMNYGSMRVRQLVEGYNIADAYVGNITVSFWVKSNVTGSYNVQVANSDFSRSYNAEFTIDSANTWERKIVIVPLSDGVSSGTWNTNNLAGIQLNFVMNNSTKTGSLDTWQSNGYAPSNLVSWGTSGDSFYLTGVQLEVGDTATPFEHRSYGEELALCQRYFYKTYPTDRYAGFNTADLVREGACITRNQDNNGRTANHWPFHYPVTMRAKPTITVYSFDGTADSVSELTGSLDHSANIALTNFYDTDHQGGWQVLNILTALGSLNFGGFHVYANSEL